MTNTTVLTKLVIFGVGLIGGSFALALRSAGLARHIVGIGRGQQNLQYALTHGIIDEIGVDLAAALHNADMVLLAMPVGQTAHVIAQIATHLQANTIITDAGSTKQDIIAEARHHFTMQNRHHFVPGHPIAGTEESGAQAAQINLFAGKYVILTPLPETSTDATEKVRQLWQACGAQVSIMSAAEHDQILAATSHLPHILAFTMMNHLRHSSSDLAHLLHFSGSGLRDFTRIAGSSPEMWRDICLTNREILLQQIDNYLNELNLLRETLERNDGSALEQIFSKAQYARKNWLKSNQ
ncbi:MAG: prephenate dehydrogenase/arogenate dehydrogenase family protein [Nitrosomonas sp. PRO4]|nr:prephenate dehydrogenase/arogenate dehydrogenase family protein [Nitrosomonas sp. PRO4]